MKKYPNWVEMPDELMSNIFQRLRTAEILNCAWKVCTTWRRICKDPAMWKVIDIKKGQEDGCDTNCALEMLCICKQAVDLSSGELIDISLRGFCTDGLLHHIVLHSSKLKRLCLMDSFFITGSGLSRAVKRVPLLEELWLTPISLDVQDIEVIGQNCPQLKSFTMDLMNDGPIIRCDDHVVAIANNMPCLHHLEIYGDDMTNDGFQAILNGFPYLESLSIHMRISFFLDTNLVEKCIKRVKDFEHNSTYDYASFDDINFSESEVDEFSQEED